MRLLICLLFTMMAIASSAIENTVVNSADLNKDIVWAFEENKGQVTGSDASQVKYFYKQGDMTLFLMTTGIAYQIERFHYPDSFGYHSSKRSTRDYEKFSELSEGITQETYRMDIKLIGASKNAEITVEGKSRDYLQYYNHNVLDVRSYQKVIYHDIYPSIDWVIYKSGEGVKYDFVVRPGGDPSDIKIKSKWAEEMNVQEDGSLIMKNRMGEITEQKPVSYQGDQKVETSFKLKKNSIQFDVADYDKTQVLTIDPVLIWATYYGGSSYDFASGCTTDSKNNVYQTGTTNSSNNIAIGGHQNTKTSIDAYLVKFDSTGVRLWGTYYLGGGTSCTVDKNDNIYFTGSVGGHVLTNVSHNGHQNTSGGGGYDAILVKFNSLGVRLWGTYYGGSNSESGWSCSTDKYGNVYVAGTTSSTNNIAFNGFKNTLTIDTLYNQDNFLVKFDSAGVRKWATYYGGRLFDNDPSCKADNKGNVYLSGYTASADSIAINGFLNTNPSPSGCSYLVKFDSVGNRIWGTYYGTGAELGTGGCDVDNDNNVYLYVNSKSDSLGFNGHTNYNPNRFNEAIVVKFNPDGIRQWATYFGGNHNENTEGGNCSVDMYGNVFICGQTFSDSGLAYKAYQDTYGGNGDLFLAKFDSTGDLIWGTYYGGSGVPQSALSGEDYAWCSADNSGNVYLSGRTFSKTGMSFHGHQNAFGGSNTDGFLAKFTDRLEVKIENDVNDTLCVGDTASFTSEVFYIGESISYQWYKNLSPIDTNDSVRASDLSQGDSIRCFVTRVLSDFVSDSVWSNTIYMTVFSKDTVMIFDTLCSNEIYTFKGDTLKGSGIYRDTLTNVRGCDSFVILNLLVDKADTVNISDTVCNQVSYSFGSKIAFMSGLYRDTLTNQYGCDSFVILDLIMAKSDTVILFDSSCNNIPYSFDGNSFTQSGIYLDTLMNSLGCDSFIELHLMVHQADTTYLSDTICQGQSYTFFSQNFITSGTYYNTLENQYKCDSLIVLNLTVLKLDTTYQSQSICQGDSVFFNNQYLKQSGLYLDTFSSVNNCDSFIFYTLTVTLDTTYKIQSICQGDSLFFNNQYLKQSGVYFGTLSKVNGCDSVVSLTLTVTLDTTFKSQSICQGDSLLFNGQYLKQNGLYFDTLVDNSGCEYILGLNIDVLQDVISNEVKYICFGDSVFVGGKYIKINGTYNDTTISSYGCDSIHMTQIIVRPESIVTREVILCDGDSFEYKGNIYKGSTTIYDTFIDSLTNCERILLITLENDDCREPIDECKRILIPTGFSPNSDGVNDYFLPIVKSDSIRVDNLHVFNRWGEIVYNYPKDKKYWNGTYRNEKCIAGTYTYLLKYTCKTKTYSKEGTLTIIR